MPRDELLRTGDPDRIWQKYCSFLDLTLPEFMGIQEKLLMQHLNLVCDSALAKKFIGTKPGSVAEFRQSVPFTTSSDYAPYLHQGNEGILAIKPKFWGHTSGRGGKFKWVPYSKGGVDAFIQYGTAMGILACTSKKGEVNIRSGLRLLQNLPPPPYIAGILNQLFEEWWDARIIPPSNKYRDADFKTKIEAGFRIALSEGVDLLMSLTTVLIKMGESFTESQRRMKFSRGMLKPQIMWRLIRAVAVSKKEGRHILPKDLWPLKGLICYGTDTGIYRDRLLHLWGKWPFETYAATEAGVIAMHAWNKKDMTFTPLSCFLEFIPEEEWLKNRSDAGFKPSTILLDQVKAGQRYEVVFTSFYGMPYLRYRLGDLIKITALEDREAGIKIPQMVFESRADDLIDIAGFSRLDERTIWQAIANTGVKHEDWTARKEYDNGEVVLRVYIELKETIEVAVLEKQLQQELVRINRDYEDLQNMLGVRPIRVTVLPIGSFDRYLQEKQKAGYDLAHLKPRHTNVPDDVIRDLAKPPAIA